MRISDWSSDVCSSDLPGRGGLRGVGRKTEDMMPKTTPIEVIPTGAALAADVRGVDLSRPETIDETVFQAILDAWHEHLVLRFQGQKLSEDAQIGRAARRERG